VAFVLSEHGCGSFRLPGRGVEVPHPIAAENRLEGLDCQGWRLRHRLGDGPEGAPLTGLSWRATQSEADEAPRVRPGVSRPVSGRNELALCVANALMRGQMSHVDQVTCCAC
jgi:hypothetical protein